MKQFISFAVLAIMLTAALAPGNAGAAEAGFSPVQEQAVKDIVRTYLGQHPEVLVDAIRALQARQQAKSKADAQSVLSSRRDQLENDPDSPVGGNPKGDVTIIEFFDYRCGYCKRVFPSMMTLIKTDGNIRYILKEFPILGPASVTASRVALAVWKQNRGKYMSFHSGLMKAKGGLNEKKIMRIAAGIGLDTKKLSKGMKADWITAELGKNMQLAKELKISGTPAFIIGRKFIPGALSLDSLKKMVQAARRG